MRIIFWGVGGEKKDAFAYASRGKKNHLVRVEGAKSKAEERREIPNPIPQKSTSRGLGGGPTTPYIDARSSSNQWNCYFLVLLTTPYYVLLA